MGNALLQHLSSEDIYVVNASHRSQAVSHMVETDKEWLVFVIAGDTDAHFAVQFRQVVFKLGSQLSIGDIVDISFESVLAFDHHPSPPRTQAVMVVYAVKQIDDAVFL